MYIAQWTIWWDIKWIDLQNMLVPKLELELFFSLWQWWIFTIGALNFFLSFVVHKYIIPRLYHVNMWQAWVKNNNDAILTLQVPNLHHWYIQLTHEWGEIHLKSTPTWQVDEQVENIPCTELHWVVGMPMYILQCNKRSNNRKNTNLR